MSYKGELKGPQLFYESLDNNNLGTGTFSRRAKTTNSEKVSVKNTLNGATKRLLDLFGF